MTVGGWLKKHFTCPDCGALGIWRNQGCPNGQLRWPLHRRTVPTPAPLQESARRRLPDRRRAVREIVECKDSHGNGRQYDVGFGFDEAGAIREVFCEPKEASGHKMKSGADMRGFMDDACIAISVALQMGARIADLAKYFGELRAEGESVGPPASPLGAIARAGAVLEQEVAEGGW